MSSVAGDIEHQGWRIGVSFAGAGIHGGTSFYAAYTGDVFGQPERGVLAVMARAHPPVHAVQSSDAAQIVVHEVAEGYFSAQPTLGPKRAMRRVLAGINDWLASQLRQGQGARLAPVSLSALLFRGPELAVLQIGCCALFRVRHGKVTPLLHEESAAASQAVGRAVGQDAQLSAEFAEDAAETGDRYVLLGGIGAVSRQGALALLARGGDAEALTARLCALLRQDEAVGAAAAALVLDVLARPPAADGAPDFASLPLRPPPREGDMWDGFKIGKTLYQGRYTILKAAYDTESKREVALKIPLPAMLQDEVFAAGFMREAWIGKTVRSRNVAHYLDIPAERRGSLYLVMPLYKGETLEARLTRAPPVSLPEGIGIALKLCEAVQDLAAIEVIHRDIKPDNVMLLGENETLLLDLGLAYLPGLDARDAARPGGTLRYMAPELINGAAAGARSEVFSLAVTIYRMFAGGAFPFGQREKVPLARLRPDLPSWLGQSLSRAVAPAPADRFADAGAFAAALQHGLVAGGADPATASWRSAARHLRYWRLAALVFALAFLFMVLRAFG